MMSLAKKYFPKGKTNAAMLQCAYQHGWRLMACPNFGGQGDSWPTYIFRKIAASESPPKLLFAAIKDSNIPGKLCISGPDSAQVTEAIRGSLSSVPGNDGVQITKDSYDDDHDQVIH